MPLIANGFSSVGEKTGNYHQSSSKVNPTHVHIPEDRQSCMSNLQRSSSLVVGIDFKTSQLFDSHLVRLNSRFCKSLVSCPIKYVASPAEATENKQPSI